MPRIRSVTSGGTTPSREDTIWFRPDHARAVSTPAPFAVAPSFAPGPPIPNMYFENGPAARIANAATLSDPDSANFDTGSLVVSTAAATAFDQLGIRNEGTNAGQIGLAGNQVLYGGVAIGTAAGGANGASLVISFNANATPEAAQALARNITFSSTNEALQSGGRTFTLVVDDGDGGTAQIQTSLQAFGVNDAPVLQAFGFGPSQYVIGAGPLLLDVDAALSDIDSPDFSGGELRLSITDGAVGSEDVLGLSSGGSVSVVGGTVSVGGVSVGTLSGGGTGGGDLVIAFNAGATLARVAEVIHNLTYWNSSAAAFSGIRAIAMTLRDGDGTFFQGQDSATASIDVQVMSGGGSTGLPPSFSLGSHFPHQFQEGAAFPVRIAGSALLSDPDSPDFGGGSLAVAMVGGTAFDQIGLFDGEGITRTGNTIFYNGVAIGLASGGNGSPLVIALNSSATPTITERLVRNLTYKSTSEAPPDGLQTFTIVINDGDGNLAQIASTVNVLAVNDAPVMANLYGDFQVFTTGGGPVRLDVNAAAMVSDIDSPDFTNGGLRVQISGGFNGSEDQLGLASNSAFAIAGSNLLHNGLVIGTVLANGGPDGEDLWFLFHSGVTIGQAQALIQAVTYWNSDSTPTDALKVITVTLDDGDGTANGGDDSSSATVQVQVGQPVIPVQLTLPGHATSDVVMNAAGTRLYEAGDDGFVRAYDAGTGAALGAWDVGARLGAIDLSPDGQFLIVVDRQELVESTESSTVAVYRIDLGTGVVTTYQTVVPGMNGAFFDVAILADGRVLLPGSFNGTASAGQLLLDPETGVFTIVGPEFGGSTTVETTADGAHILLASSSGSSGAIALVAIDAANTLNILHDTSLFSVVPTTSGFNRGALAISAEAGYVAHGTGGLHIWDLELNFQFSVNASGELFSPTGLTDLAFDADGEFLFVLDSITNRIEQISAADWNVVRTINVLSDVIQDWLVNGAFAIYANRLSLDDTMGRFVVETGTQIVRIDAAMPALNLVGDAGANDLAGSIGDDVLDGGAGADAMAGGHGDDLYHVDNVGDIVQNEALRKGTDTLIATVSYALNSGAAVEIIRTSSAAGSAAIDLAGNEFGQSLTGNAGQNILRGEGGNDVLDGLGGSDFLVGGSGADRMTGGVGDDTYYVDDAADVVIEAAGEGEDRVAASASYVLAADASVELLEAVSSAATNALDLTGSDIANVLRGNSGTNILRGGGGADTLFGEGGADFMVGGAGGDAMYGGGGDDTYYVEQTNDAVHEAAGGGNDRIATNVSFAVEGGSEVELIEALTLSSTHAMDLTGSDFAETLRGNSGTNILRGGGGNDLLFGYAGDDFLLGGTGVDYLWGDTGDDTYYVDDIGDVITEVAGEGNDRVAASVSFALDGASQVEIIEAVTLTATNEMHFTGSDFANVITGNNGVNILRGQGGDDVMASAGGDDFLDGGSGNDRMAGGTGNDVYYVDSQGDLIEEAVGAGADRIAATASYRLGAGSQVELLEAVNRAGVEAFDFTGNGFANMLAGNDGANRLDGGGGADTLVGYGGADSFVFTTAPGGGNLATIADFVAADDVIELDDAAFAGLALGAIDPNAFIVGSTASTSAHRIVYDGATGQLFYDADGNGSGAAVLFATLQGAPVLTASDFILI